MAFLRGINVGGHRKVPMAELRALVAGLGHTDVATYVASGNVVLTAPGATRAGLEADLAAAVAERFGFTVPVLVRRADDLERVIAADPFPDASAATPKHCFVAFASAPLPPVGLDALDPARFAPDEWVVGAEELYLRYEDGAGRSKLTNDLLERTLGVDLTSRNWNTVLAVADLLSRP